MRKIISLGLVSLTAISLVGCSSKPTLSLNKKSVTAFATVKGKATPGATIRFTDTSTKHTEKTVADEDGKFEEDDLTSGTYKVVASKDDQKSESKTLKVKGYASTYDDSESDESDDDSYDYDEDSSEESSTVAPEDVNTADYQTTIAYDSLARTPDDYKGEKVAFTGTVLQVMEDDDENELRVAIDDDYDNVVLVGYDPDIMSGSRILEDDTVTFYGESVGTMTYESTMGGDITIPAVLAAKIDDQGQTASDY
ncbi:carboxypeptidase-like regulatory domain-containing protein [Loigolactobacillus coryniformis]|jgi:hypothetical protein|uniref:Carboxypeptidase regulatory-like domain-containing protein n=2 Tax=Loigolactobacillus TaxID=2767889 RepID=A0A5B8TLU6_9LACO|nr:carboxypeptidase-like regulatory domain-containing protein [Loigolactobacillus coryniformis]MCL5457582.1 carboxypeptidase-like regulatory domain-containing protein [Loigolactobacillus coryniformis]QEA54206.1 carboxypeptidase regulatory-like domain-containing protein [Loigolactobacillus coryniformis]